ncbi:MAG: hypothetical protein JST06_00645 [Bacteroidetes bacterium]|nr:hypothetical protein [Bacteroidota bacterium]MBS1630037.1 hypothetical protein [Bacteroidota bacterium]
MNRVILALCVLPLLFVACKKSDSTTSIEEDLRSGVWTRSSGKVSSLDPVTRKEVIWDYWSAQPDCIRDNSLQFNADYTGIIDHGKKFCTSAETSTQFHWEVSSDQQHISLYGVQDYFPVQDVNATILTRDLGYLTIRYQVITADAAHSTYDTLTYTDVLRR